ncbi:MAG: 1-acyl-sn-glycerol-3-phosphate acyltransferase [Planctomycetes bacterium]|nr:1-acyl-sn-glycerol-3-phosphate acyltransferase [Planctomycetota bacterium]
MPAELDAAESSKAIGRAAAAPPPRPLIAVLWSAAIEVLWRIVISILQVLFRIVAWPKREGPYLPKGPLIVAPNHCSFMDPVILQMACWRHLSPMMTEIYYNPIAVRWLFYWMRAIPVKEGRGNRDALAVAVDRIQRGWALCIYPEGAISRDGRLQKFQPGISALAEASGAPVVPVAIVGTFEAFPRNASFPKLFRRYVVRFGEPIPPPEPGDESTRRERLRAHTERVRQAVIAMLEPRQLPQTPPES